MTNEKVYGMLFSKVYPMLIAKAERKGRTKDEVLEITEKGIRPKKYFETEHFKTTKSFLDNPERMLHYLLD